MTDSVDPKPRGLGRRLLGLLIALPIGVFVLVLTIVAALFLNFSPLPWAGVRTAMAGAFVVAVLAAFILMKPRWKGLLVFAGLFAIVALWFSSIRASNDREWQPDVARVARADIDGDTLVVHNVRAFNYRSVSDFDEHWETRTYDLAALQTLDIFFSYWGPTDIAHTMMTFGFADGQRLCLSVETRKEVGEEYAPLRSFFKQFELIYIFADERDLVALRTNHRLEDTYLFPSKYTPEQVRRLLLDILDRVNSLAERPEFYRTIRDNCTTALIGHLNIVRDEPMPLSFDLLFNGNIPRVAYEQGDLPQDAPFEEVIQRFAISERGRAFGQGPGYSEAIRVGNGKPAGED